MGNSTVWAIRTSAGLSARLRSNGKLLFGSSDVRDLGFEEDEELVLADSVREWFLGLDVSGVGIEGFLRNTFLGALAVPLSCCLPAEIVVETEGILDTERPDAALVVEPHDWGW